MDPEWGRGGMYETSITGAEGVLVNLSMVIRGVRCLSKYSLLFLLPLAWPCPCDPRTAIIHCAADLAGPPAPLLLPTRPHGIRPQ